MADKRHGDWMQTFTGKQFWPLDPRAEEVCIEDIAHSLSMQCRFAGHCRKFYSVAEHSIRVADLLGKKGYDRTVQLMGLLHDASEAYLVDLPRPVKSVVKGYRAAEGFVMEVICERFGLVYINNPGPWTLVKEADNVLLATEARDLMGPPPAPWEALPEPHPLIILPVPPDQAETLFLRRFRLLTEVSHG